jgi:hypothetical protein
MSYREATTLSKTQSFYATALTVPATVAKRSHRLVRLRGTAKAQLPPDTFYRARACLLLGGRQRRTGDVPNAPAHY